MKTFMLALVLACFVLPACDEPQPEQMPVVPQAPVDPVVARPPPPPPYDFPIEDHAMKSLRVFDVLSSEASYVFVVSNPTELFEILGGPEPEDTDFGKLHEPDWTDLHPKRLTAMGLDPTKPVGLAIHGKLKQPTESAVWAAFGSIADEAVFRKAFGLGKLHESGVYPPSNDDDRRTFLALDNGEVVIASRPDPLSSDARPLSQDETFVKLRGALDYGAMATAYFNIKRGKAMYGVGLDEVGLGVKVVADSELQAGTTRIKFAELPASLDPQLPYLTRVTDMKAEMHPTGRALRKQIDTVEDRPRKRRAEAAKQMLADVEVAGSLDKVEDSLAIAGRVWKVTPADVVRAYEVWRELGHTEEENYKLADLRTALASVQTVDDIDTDALEGRVADLSETAARNLNGNKGMSGVTDMMGKFGGMIGGGGGGGKGKEKSGGMLGNLGNLGNMMGGGGGGGGGSDIDVTSSNSELRSHVRRKAQALALCWAKHPSEKTFTVIANVEIAPKTGDLSLTRLRNAPDTMDACLRRIISGRIKPPELPLPDPEAPPEEPKPEKASLKITFKRG